MAFLLPINGHDRAMPPSPSASVCRRVSRGSLFLPLRSFPLHLPGGAGRRALGAVLEPFGEFGDGRHVDLRRPRPGEYAGDIEVGDCEAVPEQVRATAESAAEHL